MAFISTDPSTVDGLESSKESEEETVERLDRMVREAINHPVNERWRQRAEVAFKYEEGDQLDAMILAALAERKQPPVIENMIRPQRKVFMKNYMKMRLKAAFMGRNAGMDDAHAFMLNDLNRSVDQENNFLREEGQAVKDAFIGGLGWIERQHEIGRDGWPRIAARREDPFVMWRDPFGRRLDLSDSRYLIRSKWVDLDEAIAAMPDKRQELVNCISSGSSPVARHGLLDPSWDQANEFGFIDAQRKRLRLFEVWYRRREQRQATITPEGVRVTLDFLGERQAKQAIERAGLVAESVIIDQMWVGLYCGMTLLHHDRSPYINNQFPFTMYFWNLKKDGSAIGWVSEDMMSLQDALNKRQSKALHLLNNRQLIIADNATEMNDEQLATAIASPDGIFRITSGRNVSDVISLVSNTELGQSQLAMYNQSKQAFTDTGGRSEVSEGQAPGDVRSDRGLARLEANAAGMDAEVFENIKLSRKMGLLVQTAMIQQFYTEQMVFQVTENEEDVRVFQLTKDDFTAIRKYNVNLAIIEEPDYTTSRQQQIDAIFQTLPQVLQFGSGWANVLLGMTTLRDKEKLMEQVAALSQAPPPEPKISLALSWADLSINDRLIWAIKLGFPQELIQAMQDGAIPSKTEMLVQSDQAKQASKETMEQKRLDLKVVEMDVKDSHHEQDARLDALKTSVQEETRRMVADKQAQAKTRNDKS